MLLLNNFIFLYLESRPLSIPVKAMLNMPEGCRSPEERMKEFIGIVWNAVKSLTLQVK
jgi:vacuolar protein sorting-associated protein 13B